MPSSVATGSQPGASSDAAAAAVASGVAGLRGVVSVVLGRQAVITTPATVSARKRIEGMRGFGTAGQAWHNGCHRSMPTPPKPRDPDWQDKVHRSFARQTIMGLIGAELTVVAPGSVEIELPFRADLCQQHGLFHAGVTATVADSAAGYSAFTLFAPGMTVLTTEFKINLLAPAKGDRLRAVGRVIKPGRTITVAEVDVFALTDLGQTHCARMLASLICRPGADA